MMSNVVPKPNTRGHQLVFPYIWRNHLWQNSITTPREQDATTQDQKARQQEEDNTYKQAVIGQASFSGEFFRYIVYLPVNSNLWPKLPSEW